MCQFCSPLLAQVLQVLYNAEQLKVAGPKRNVLQVRRSAVCTEGMHSNGLCSKQGLISAPPRGCWRLLQLLSTNTRRTKVVELSSGTHR